MEEKNMSKKPFYKKWWFILIIIILVIGGINSIVRNRKEKFDWKEVELCDRLPEPKSNVGTIISNEDDMLSVSVEKTSKDDYKEYVEKCQSMGYTVESEKEEDRYDAFDKEGYRLALSIIDETMDIELEAPEKMGDLKWPKSKIAALLPMPKSTVGKISTDTADGCYIYVGDTSKDDFNAYADECSDKGFSVDYERGDDFYNAKDENGNQLALSYQGNKVMSIEITKTDEVEDKKENKKENKKKNKSSSKEKSKTKDGKKAKAGNNKKLVNGMRPEFKKAMDSYEKFVNEYCKFMKKYAKSNGTDSGLMADYAEYMKKYADAVKDFEAWDDGEMNTAETAYYLDVQTRINKKLLEVGK